METFAIKIIDKNIFEFYGTPCCQSEIQIKKFKETFNMPLHLWSVKDYKKQWKEGIKRIKRHNTSCFVVSMKNSNKIPLAEIWVLYKEYNKVYIQNHFIIDERVLEILKKKPFNSKTCYDFISSRKTISEDSGMKISEWEISLEAIISAKIYGKKALKESKLIIPPVWLQQYKILIKHLWPTCGYFIKMIIKFIFKITFYLVKYFQKCLKSNRLMRKLVTILFLKEKQYVHILA